MWQWVQDNLFSVATAAVALYAAVFSTVTWLVGQRQRRRDRQERLSVSLFDETQDDRAGRLFVVKVVNESPSPAFIESAYFYHPTIGPSDPSSVSPDFDWRQGRDAPVVTEGGHPRGRLASWDAVFYKFRYHAKPEVVRAMPERVLRVEVKTKGATKKKGWTIDGKELKEKILAILESASPRERSLTDMA